MEDVNHVETRALGRSARLSWVVDLGVAAVLIVVFWVRPLLESSETWIVFIAPVLMAAVVAAVLTRWLFPTLAPAVALVATGVGWALQVSTDPLLAVAWSLYPLALRQRTRGRLVGLVLVGILGAGALGLLATSGNGDPAQRAVIAIVAVGASWLFGHVEARRLEAVRGATRQQAAYDQAMQQTAMAREVHDVVGHALGVISAEADLAGSLPEQSELELRESLANIERRSRAALEQVQVLVRNLRDGGPAQAESVALPELVAAARVSGLDVETHIDLPALAAETDLVLSRVLQEALSNVVRHSSAARCRIAVWPEDDTLLVRVEDDGSGLSRRQRPGSGLTGMRERVEGIGGSLTVANRLEGGTRVLARLPLEASA